MDNIKFSKWTASFWAVFLLNSVLAGLLIFAFTHEKKTAGNHGLRFTQQQAWEDSWGPMYKAILHLREHPDIPVYSKLFFTDHIKFQYPLSSLLPLDFLQRLADISKKTLFQVLNIFSWWFVILSGIISWMIFRASHKEAVTEQPSKASDQEINFWSVIPALAITITFYPLAKSYTLGQIQTTITLLVSLSLLAWQWKKPGITGFLLGVCCAIKPQWAVVLLWGAIRKEWKFVLAGGVTFAVLTLSAIGMYGYRNYFDYLPVISFLSRHGEGFYPNQSVNGLMNRLLFNGDNLRWTANSFPPFHPVVYAFSIISAIVILGFVLLWKRNKKADAFDLALLILGLTLSSPIAWEHHYGILLPIFALITPICVLQRVMGKRTVLYLLIAFFLASQWLDFTKIFADTYFNFLQSYLFFGAIIVFWILIRIIRFQQPKGQLQSN